MTRVEFSESEQATYAASIKTANKYGQVAVLPPGWVPLRGQLATHCPLMLQKLEGWGGSKRRPRPVIGYYVPESYLAHCMAETKVERRRAARKQRKERIASEADQLGVRPDSRAFAAYRRGEIDAQECARIGAITADRHENTNYDALLQSGMDRETARELMERQST
ncbi:hypothetical protein KGP36_08310 [Patescibacteria group bacterium]|nr:hypothetical protein [Patescibacteria group bacterium]